MKQKPVLVVMAAGMGSRYGGLKQIDKLGPNGEVIIDYSLYDAHRAGFDKVVFIIKHAIENDFKEIINRGAGKHMEVAYAFQEVADIPEGFSVPEERVKPWGTGHAILSAKDLIDGPFAVINADDYYGPGVFKTIYEYLSNAEDTDKYDYCMAGYKLKNTMSETGSVARGVCVAENGYLKRIDERTDIRKMDGTIKFTEDGGQTFTEVDPDSTVSMNFFGFTPSILKELEERFPAALENILKTNPIKGEFYIPIVSSELIVEGKANMKVLPCNDKWFGVTNKEDRPIVVESFKRLTEEGVYPVDLWK